jgi:hypothetical protein
VHARRPAAWHCGIWSTSTHRFWLQNVEKLANSWRAQNTDEGQRKFGLALHCEAELARDVAANPLLSQLARSGGCDGLLLRCKHLGSLLIHLLHSLGSLLQSSGLHGLSGQCSLLLRCLLLLQGSLNLSGLGCRLLLLELLPSLDLRRLSGRPLLLHNLSGPMQLAVALPAVAVRQPEPERPGLSPSVGAVAKLWLWPVFRSRASATPGHDVDTSRGPDLCR